MGFMGFDPFMYATARLYFRVHVNYRSKLRASAVPDIILTPTPLPHPVKRLEIPGGWRSDLKGQRLNWDFLGVILCIHNLQRIPIISHDLRMPTKWVLKNSFGGPELKNVDTLTVVTDGFTASAFDCKDEKNHTVIFEKKHGCIWIFS